MATIKFNDKRNISGPSIIFLTKEQAASGKPNVVADNVFRAQLSGLVREKRFLGEAIAASFTC